jgi:hypothetical protein
MAYHDNNSYIHGVSQGRITISTEEWHTGTSTYSLYDIIIYDLSQNKRLNLQGYSYYGSGGTATGPRDSIAYNTGLYISSGENLCTNGLHYFSAMPAELYCSNATEPYPFKFAQANNAIYHDGAHNQNSLQNILLDTLNRRVFLVFSTQLSILSYQRYPTGIIRPASKTSSLPKRLSVLTTPVGITIVLPENSRNADLFICDVSGRIVERMLHITSNAVLWRPKTGSKNIYLAILKNGNDRYTSKFIAQ